MAERFGVVLEAGACALGSVRALEGTSTWYSLMIWSAILRRSDERIGARFLICLGQYGGVAETAGRGMTHRRLLLEHNADGRNENAMDTTMKHRSNSKKRPSYLQILCWTELSNATNNGAGPAME